MGPCIFGFPGAGADPDGLEMPLLGLISLIPFLERETMPDTAAPPAPTSADPDLLSERQRLFCLLYARGGNGRAAAEGAGYSPRTARQQASRLLTYADIRETIADLRAEAEEQNGIERAELIARLDYVYLRAMTRGEYHPAIRAVEAQAKLSGLLPARLTLAEARLIARAQADLAAETAEAATDAAEPAPDADGRVAPTDVDAPVVASATPPDVMRGLDPRIPDGSPETPPDDAAVPTEGIRGSSPRMTVEKTETAERLATAERPEMPDLAAPDRAAPAGWGPRMSDGKGGVTTFSYGGFAASDRAGPGRPAASAAADANAVRTPAPEPFVPTAAQRKAAASALAWAGHAPESASSAASAASSSACSAS